MPLKLCAEGKNGYRLSDRRNRPSWSGQATGRNRHNAGKEPSGYIDPGFSGGDLYGQFRYRTGYGALSPDSGMEWVGGNPQPGSIHQKSNETGGTGQNCVDSFFAA